MDGLLHVLVVTPIAYIALVAFLRISGKRTLTKLNAFDLVVTVALGSTLATIALNTSVSLAQGLLALALLIGLQYLITWASVRSSLVEELVKSEPTLLLYRGAFIEPALRSQRVTKDEIAAALRNSGIASIADVDAVVLETDGSLSTITSADWDRATALTGVIQPASITPDQPAEPSPASPVANWHRPHRSGRNS